MSALSDTDISAARPTSWSANPFRASAQQAAPQASLKTLDYVINKERVRVSPEQYGCFEHIWRQLPMLVPGAMDVEGGHWQIRCDVFK
jgi:hypothetical protein